MDFWATLCGPCCKLIPELNEWAKKYEKDLQIVGLSDEAPETVQEFMKKNPMNYGVAIDTQKQASNALGIQGIPHVMVISKDGTVRWQGFPGLPEDKLDEAKLVQMIEANKALK